MGNPFEPIEKRLSAIEDLLSELKQSILERKEQEVSDVIGIDDVASILHLSKETIYSKTCRKLIPHTKKGKKLLFSKKAILEYVSSGEVKTIQQEFRETQKLVADKISKHQDKIRA